MKIIFDVWGGQGHCSHVARYFFGNIAEVMVQLSAELAAGYLVNVRSVEGESVWGPDDVFDTRNGVAVN